MLDKALIILENRLIELKQLPYEDVIEWIASTERAIMILKQNQSYEEDLENMYQQHLKESA